MMYICSLCSLGWSRRYAAEVHLGSFKNCAAVSCSLTVSKTSASLGHAPPRTQLPLPTVINSTVNSGGRHVRCWREFITSHVDYCNDACLVISATFSRRLQATPLPARSSLDGDNMTARHRRNCTADGVGLCARSRTRVVQRRRCDSSVVSVDVKSCDVYFALRTAQFPFISTSCVQRSSVYDTIRCDKLYSRAPKS